MHLMRKHAIVICITYLLLFPLAVYCAYRYLGNTKLVYKPPVGSLVDRSEKNAQELFQAQILNDPLFLLVRNIPAGQSIVANDNFRNFTLMLHEEAVNGTLAPFAIFIDAYWLIPENVPQFRNKMIGGTNNDTTLVSISVRRNIERLTTLVTNFYDEWSRRHEQGNVSFSLQTTSVESISKDLESGIFLDLVKIDAISLPLAFCCFAYCLKSFRMLIIPAITVVTTIVFAYALMFPVSLATTMSAFAPEMSAAVMSAISIDYTLFILTRFADQVRLQELSYGRTEEVKWNVVWRTTELSAHNILVSGITIAAALGGLGIIPIPFLSTIGIAFCIGAITAIVVAMTLMPAILLIFYDFFAKQLDCGELKRKCGCGEDSSSFADPAGEQSSLLQGQTPTNPTVPVSPLESPTTLEEHNELERQEQYSSVWFKVGILAFRHPIVMCAAVLAAGVPFFYFASELETNFDLFAQVPRDSPHAAILKSIVSEVGRGSTTPFYVTFTTPEAGGLMRDEVFALVNNMTLSICDRSGQPLDRVLSFSYVPGIGFITSADEAAILATVSPEYAFLFNRTVDATRRAGLIALYTTFDPFSSVANKFLNSVDSVLQDWDSEAKRLNVTLGLLGASADSWAIMQAVMKLFPVLIGVTLAVIFVFIAVVFRSAVIPLRMVFTVAYTIALALGFGVVLFQYPGVRDVWPGIGIVESYSWTVPIFSNSLLAALSLDFDVFLLTRVIEYKKLGFNDEAATAKAVWKTGRIISFAGLIMAISFGSLMFSNTAMLAQFGAVASFAILVDTFVIRPIFVPALMSIYPAASYWPRRFPDADRDVDDMRELPDEHCSPEY